MLRNSTGTSLASACATTPGTANVQRAFFWGLVSPDLSEQPQRATAAAAKAGTNRQNDCGKGRGSASQRGASLHCDGALLPLPASEARGEGWGEGHKRTGKPVRGRLSDRAASSPQPSPPKEEREIESSAGGGVQMRPRLRALRARSRLLCGFIRN